MVYEIRIDQNANGKGFDIRLNGEVVACAKDYLAADTAAWLIEKQVAGLPNALYDRNEL